MRAYDTSFQIYTFLSLVYAGMFSSIIYDLLLPACRNCSLPLRILMDVFVSAVTAFLLFLSLYATGSASVRLYMIFAFGIGALVYRLGIRSLLRLLIKSAAQKRKTKLRGE